MFISTSAFEQTQWQEIQQFIVDYPLATLITQTIDGIQAAHIPMILQQKENSETVLIGHIAHANPIWQSNFNDSEWLAIFNTNGYYITPNWYPEKHITHRAVPTWNFQAVHVRGKLNFLDDTAAVLAMQTDVWEHQLPNNSAWKLNDAPEDYLQSMYGAIVCFEMSMDSVQAQFKLSQNKSAETRSSIAHNLRQTGTHEATHMADLIEKYSPK
ncbi:FMN-binding negative transcriptional regulator [Wielerella bovis]|uniref:FMN-binding negative transcriptional regulator n=1 Tax=Wielerella bovis TaxID=2917790 RepID=UPI002018AC96|nr:FMN-binding negative transcriptional regulator [Wielerella bovis]ULJ59797.1 FMN-binding negative transcriptional regulator [Wielerella bovis]ULJ64226.1 FMN-binding negative transcriptional regulator [Wielerella bovis]ULJ67855.1 FMN-binding negative transcriptional regulator [Wielerella bovis]